MKGLASREMRGIHCGVRDWDDLGAVNEFSRVLAEDSHLGHGILEATNHQVVVGCRVLIEREDLRSS